MRQDPREAAFGLMIVVLLIAASGSAAESGWSFRVWQPDESSPNEPISGIATRPMAICGLPRRRVYPASTEFHSNSFHQSAGMAVKRPALQRLLKDEVVHCWSRFIQGQSFA